jgi:mono/diheme cytochrome c family protein
MSKLKLLIPVLAGGFALIAWPQEQSSDPRMTSEKPMSGQELFQVFCAACHGPAGKGDGPVAGELRRHVPDLTLLTRTSGGAFPITKVERAIDGDEILISHGTRDMPIYGDLFRAIRRDEVFVKQRVALLTGYIESIQNK